MRKKIKIVPTLMLAIGLTFIMTGCKEKEIVTPKYGVSDPDVEVKSGIEIDWDQVRYELEELMISDDYPLVSYIDFAVYEDRNIIRLILPLKNEATQIEALDYGASYIKVFNDTVAVQDFSIAKSSEGYYGGLWDKYNLELEVFREADLMEAELYYVNQAMDAGSNSPVIPQIIQTKTEEATSEGNQE